MYNKDMYFHFIGVGGVGMSSIAEILLGLGYRVSGSDLKCVYSCQRLVKMGAEIKQGHQADNLPCNCDVVVYSSVVNDCNPEIIEAKKRGLTIVKRAEVLAELMRLKYGVAVAGSHGKTSTTEMVARVLIEGELDPTVLIGGKIKSVGTGSRLGHGQFLVAESDESDRSFLLLQPTIAVVTNIDEEHMVAYKSIDDLVQSFGELINKVPFSGAAVLCTDNERVRSLINLNKITNKKIISYGLNAEAEWQAKNMFCEVSGTSYDLYHFDQYLGKIKLKLLGRHFALNSLAAVAVGYELKIPLDKIVLALSKVEGVERRLEEIGNINGVKVISDYAHHPTEIMASLKAIREVYNQHTIHVVFEPHRYSRLSDCFNQFLTAFSDCDDLLVTDVYAACEKPINDMNSENLVSKIQHLHVQYAPTYEDIVAKLHSNLSQNEVVVFMGAGLAGSYAYRFLSEIENNIKQVA